MNDKTAKMRCSHCEKVIKFPIGRVGQSAKCPSCQKPIDLVDQRKPATELVTQNRQSFPLPTEVPQSESPVLDAELIRTEYVDSKLARFIADGQPPEKIAKLLSRVESVCTDSEEAQYIAVQHLPGVLSPDAVVLTNKRVIILRAKALGRMNLVDVPWLNVRNIHIKEGIVGAAVSVTGMNGHTETIDHLPKSQARHLYRIGQEREEAMVEVRRQRMMEEQRNAANQVNVNTTVPAAEPIQSGATDLTARLKQLKELHDAGLIDDAEFESKKISMLESI